jgi:hypothetical protein
MAPVSDLELPGSKPPALPFADPQTRMMDDLVIHWAALTLGSALGEGCLGAAHKGMWQVVGCEVRGPNP